MIDSSKSLNMKTAGKVLTALGIGLAAGAVTGILLAPRKGSETRNILRKKGSKMADTVVDTINDGKQKINAIKDGFREKVAEMNKKVQEFS
jgi:gas vesicle protein